MFFEQLVESAPDAMLVVDRDGTIVYANRRCEALAAWDRSELVGRPVELLVPAAARLVHPDHRARYAVAAHARPMGVGLDLHLATADGREVPVDIGLSPLEGTDGLVAAAVRDTTDRRRTELELRAAQAALERTVEDLRRTSELLAVANELGDLLHSCRTVEDVYAVLVRYGGRYFPASDGAVYRPGGARSLTLRRTWGTADGFVGDIDADSCWAARRGRVHVRRSEADLPCAHLGADARSACAPLLAHGEVLGLLVVRFDPATPVPDDVEARARSLAEHLSLSLANIELRERLQAESVRDPLTGLYNRRFLADHLARELQRCTRADLPVALLAIDLDRFKRFNDELGHGAGDSALVAVAALLQQRCRAEDVVCRMGGEEFLVVLPATSLTDATARAEELRAACQELPLAAGRALTMSVGVAVSPRHGRRPDELLAAVDAALYAAKRGGRDRVAVARSGDEGPG